MPKQLHLPFPWNPGQHMAIVGMTGSGKSTLAATILSQRKYLVILRSKADQVTYPATRTFASSSAMDDPRVSRLVLRPKFERQQSEFADALNKVWRQGGWTVFVDELYYVDEELRLRALVNRLLTQGRDPGRISVVCGMQRPTNITRFAIGEASHVVCFGLERRDAKILEHQKLAAVVEELPQHHFAWLHVPSRRIWRGKLNIKTGELQGELV